MESRRKRDVESKSEREWIMGEWESGLGRDCGRVREKKRVRVEEIGRGKVQ